MIGPEPFGSEGPIAAIGKNGVWRRRFVAKGTVRPDGVAVPSPLLDEHLRLFERVEDLSVQELVPELAVEALVVAVLPRTARLDVERLYAEPPQPGGLCRRSRTDPV